MQYSLTKKLATWFFLDKNAYYLLIIINETHMNNRTEQNQTVEANNKKKWWQRFPYGKKFKLLTILGVGNTIANTTLTVVRTLGNSVKAKEANAAMIVTGIAHTANTAASLLVSYSQYKIIKQLVNKYHLTNGRISQLQWKLFQVSLFTVETLQTLGLSVTSIYPIVAASDELKKDDVSIDTTAMVTQTISMTAFLALRIISHLWLDPFAAQIHEMAEEEKLRIAKAEGMEEGQLELQQIQTQLRDTQDFINFIQQIFNHETDLSPEHRKTAFSNTMPIWIKAGMNYPLFIDLNSNQLENINSSNITNYLELNILTIDAALNLRHWVRDAIEDEVIHAWLGQQNANTRKAYINILKQATENQLKHKCLRNLLINGKLKIENLIKLSDLTIDKMIPESELYSRVMQEGDEHLLVELGIQLADASGADYHIENSSGLYRR